MFTYAYFAAHREPAYTSCGDKFNSLGHPINPLLVVYLLGRFPNRPKQFKLSL